ncbi:hypothetical protein SESBI_25524 [Sesbania bispinosa]|nr:hypothetical protein SESBI_25524 [Sesbania bispinosa]
MGKEETTQKPKETKRNKGYTRGKETPKASTCSRCWRSAGGYANDILEKNSQVPS